MKSDMSIPVFDLADCVPATDFIIKFTEGESVHPDALLPHRMNAFKICLLLEGEVSNFADFKEYTAKGPALLFLSPGQVYQHTGVAWHKMVHILFKRDFLMSEAQGILSCWECLFNQVVLPVNSPGAVKELETYARLMHQEFLHRRPQREMVVRNLLNAFIISAARLGTCETKIVHMDSTQNKVVRQFKELTEAHFLKRTRVSQYADMLCITPGHLNDLIKMATGRTAKQIIDERRIMEAKRLLFWGKHSVKEIASHLNFEDDAYFNRFFKKHTGQAPALFLKYSREKYNEYPDKVNV